MTAKPRQAELLKMLISDGARNPPAGSLSTLDLSRDSLPELRAGALGVRIAENKAEREAAQALRYRVFFEKWARIPARQP